jgi:protein-L-isoaspartate(D-aspartate) O-methyltransferase
MGTEATELAQRLSGAIRDDRVLAAIASVPRERFVPESQRPRAYENVALPIDCGQTISQPLVVARMLELLELKPTDHVLDVGTGSGYHAALLALLAEHVSTIERHSALTDQARAAITSLGLSNVTFFVGDGNAGLPEHGPFDAINVAAASGKDAPATLAEQLADAGRLVVPVGNTNQRLVLIRRQGKRLTRAELDRVRFVPLVRGN